MEDVPALMTQLEIALKPWNGDGYEKDGNIFRFIIKVCKSERINASILKRFPVLYISMYGEIQFVQTHKGISISCRLMQSIVSIIIMLIPFLFFGLIVVFTIVDEA